MTILAEMTMLIRDDHDDDQNKKQALVLVRTFSENFVDCLQL